MMCRGILFTMCIFQLLVSGVVTAAEDNLIFRGRLVSEPCVIPAGEEDIPLEFNSVTAKYLYENIRTEGQAFAIHLVGCDPSVARTVKVTFGGTESGNVPGALSLDPGSQARGVVIGLETDMGESQFINQASPALVLSEGDNWLGWKAYIQGEPSALSNKTILPGDFTATATFSLAYD